MAYTVPKRALDYDTKNLIGDGPNMVSESTVSNTELSESCCSHRVPGENSVNTSQPFFGVQRRTHRVLRRVRPKFSVFYLPKQYSQNIYSAHFRIKPQLAMLSQRSGPQTASALHLAIWAEIPPPLDPFLGDPLPNNPTYLTIGPLRACSAIGAIPGKNPAFPSDSLRRYVCPFSRHQGDRKPDCL